MTGSRDVAQLLRLRLRLRLPPLLPLLPLLLFLLSLIPGGEGFATDVRLTRRADSKPPVCQTLLHQSAVKDNKLYIAGGFTVYGQSSTDAQKASQQQSPTNVTKIMDLSSSFTSDFSQVSQPADMPTFDLAQLWSDDNSSSQLYLVGGKSVSGQDAGAKQVWIFDTDGQTWDSSITTKSTTNDNNNNAEILRVSSGGGAFVPSLRKGFFVGGQSVDPNAGTANLPDNVVVFDAAEMAWTNQSQSGPSGGGLLAFEQMFYVPVGKQGVLVLLGGVSTTATGLSYQSYDHVEIYDIASASWYRQQTTGTPPDPQLTGYCGIVGSAADSSSHQIVFFGGWNGSAAFADTHVLSLPTFEWFHVRGNPRDADAPSKRDVPTCNLVHEHYMVVFGGRIDGNITATGHECDADRIFIFDVAELAWGSPGVPDGKGYTVPQKVVKNIGGSGTGSATQTSPSAGFDNPALKAVFNASPSSPTTSGGSAPTTTASTSGSPGSRTKHKSKGVNKGAIAGGVVGGLAGLAIAGSLVVFWLRRRRNLKSNSNSKKPEVLAPDMPELGNEAEVYETEGKQTAPQIDGQALYELQGENSPKQKK